MRFLPLALVVFLFPSCSCNEDQPTGPSAILVINEVLARSTTGADDFIEIYNAGTAAANLASYTLTDDPLANLADPLVAYKFPSGTTIEPGAYVTLYEATAIGQTHTAPFSLSLGETITLFTPGGTAADSVALTDLRIGRDISWGRFPDGTANFIPMYSPTPDATNVDYPDLTAPDVQSTTPGQFETGVMVNPTVTVEFTEPMAQMGAAAVVTTNTPFVWVTPDVIAIGPLDLSGSRGATIDIELTGFEDLAGNPMVPYTIFFDVEPAGVNIVINEVVNGDGVLSGATGADWIELKNVSGMQIDLGTQPWVIGDSGSQYVFPPGTTINSGGYLILLANDALGNTGGYRELPFKLSNIEYLELINPSGTVVQKVVWQDGDGRGGSSFARSPDGTGGFSNRTPTPGASN